MPAGSRCVQAFLVEPAPGAPVGTDVVVPLVVAKAGHGAAVVAERPADRRALHVDPAFQAIPVGDEIDAHLAQVTVVARPVVGLDLLADGQLGELHGGDLPVQVGEFPRPSPRDAPSLCSHPIVSSSVALEPSDAVSASRPRASTQAAVAFADV